MPFIWKYRIDQKDFVREFNTDLNDDSILEKSIESNTQCHKHDIELIRDLQTQLGEQVKQQTKLNKTLQKEVADLRQVIMNKDNRIGKLQKMSRTFSWITMNNIVGEIYSV